MNTEEQFTSFEIQGVFSSVYRDRDRKDSETWRDILDDDNIFWSDEDSNLSSNTVETITVASDSDTTDCKITAINLNAFEDNQNWAEDELELDPAFPFPFKYRKC